MLNNKGTTLKNIAGVTVSNVITIVSGIVVGFLLPKVLIVEDYGLYKTFTLYMTYVGFFGLGIIDGIVLKYGGYDYSELDRHRFRSYFKWLALLQVLSAGSIVIIAMLFRNLELRRILILISVNLIAVNLTGYFQQLSQITQRFREYSLRKIIQSVLNIFVVGLTCGVYTIYGKTSYLQYLSLFIVANIGLFIWYVYTYRDIVFGKAYSLLSTKKEVLALSKTGFPLLFSNLCSILILSLDRQFVNALFSASIYAEYAFAYNLLSLVTVATSAVSTVLYPILKRTTKEMMRHNYTLLVSMVSIIVFGALGAYFPLCMFIEWFLPKYTESLDIFRIVFPGLALSSPITVIMHNFYKAEGKNLLYFKKSLVVLLISAIANAIAYVSFHSTESISIASIITMIFWYFFVEHYFNKEYLCSGSINAIYIGMMMLTFYIVTIVCNYFVGFVIYLILFIVIAFIFYKQKFSNMIEILRR